MSHLRSADSAKKNMFFTALASFVGMIAAVPVSLAVVSTLQPAHAMQAQAQPTDSSYQQYVQAYTQGYLASTKTNLSSSTDGCSAPETSKTESAPVAKTTSYKAPTTKHMNMQPMSQKKWLKQVNNSYNSYKTTQNWTTVNNTDMSKTWTKNVNVNSNNNINSNNSANSNVTVTDSNGAVVTSGAASSSKTDTNVDVVNNKSNNTVTTTTNNTTTNNTDVDVNVTDSFNKDSHDTTNVNKTKTYIEDSFNHKDVDVTKDSNNKVVLLNKA